MAARVIKIEIPIETQDKTDPTLGNVKAKLDDLDTAAAKARKSMSGFEKSLGSTSKKASGFEKVFGKRNWKVLLEAKDKITPTVKQVMIYMKNLTRKAWIVTLKAVDLATSPVRRVYGLLKSPLVAAGVTISAGAGIASTINTYADFEAAMSQVKAISGATGEEFTQLTDKAKQMGAITKFTASESAEAFKYMAQAGWDAKEMMDGIEGLMALAAASGENLGTTSDIVTDALTAFGLSAKDSGRFADVMAMASSATNTDVAKMGETFKYVAPVAGALGYTIEDTAVAIGLMANNGIKASQAGTSLRSLMTNLTRPVGQAQEAIDALNISITNTDGSVKPLAQTIQELRGKFSILTDAEKSQYAAMLAGQEGMSGLLAIVNASDRDFADLTEQINNSSGAAKRMSDVMMDNLSGKFELFTGALDSMKMSLGEKIKPYLADALEWLTEKVPDVENALLSAMNSVDRFVENTKAKIDEFKATEEWKNADFFGKVEIAWDQLIAEPFSEWWNSNGKVQVAGVAKDIGTGIGTAISAGILALMGIETSSVINEGNSIGRQFAEGFKEGMNGVNVASALGTLVTGAFSSAGKFLPGGKAPDIVSLLSAVAIAKVAGPLLNAGSGLFQAGKGIYKSAKGGLLKKAVGSFSVADELAGVGIAKGSGLLGIMGKTGMALGSGSTTSAGLAAVGGGAWAGGAIGGATLISGISDLKIGLSETEDTKKSRAYGESGAMKVGGVAAGAIAGASIGSVIPIVGTAAGALIGAGLGGIAGWIGGNHAKEDYEAQVLAAEKTKYAIEGAKFETKELKEAFEDTEVSAEEFGAMMQEATSNKIRDAFGDIKLSMQEIQEAAEKIVFGDNLAEITKFSDAAATAEQSFGNLQSSVATMDKLNWKASLGKLDATEVEEYRAAAEAMVESSLQYLEDKHYEATTAIRLLVEPENGTDMFTGLDSMYSSMQEKIESLGGQLTAKIDVALEDGVISLDEQAEITNLQNQITEITNQISQAETEAGFQTVKIKYSGADLDADSFANLMAELQAQAQSAADNYTDALEVSLSGAYFQIENAKTKLETGDITIEDYNSIQESIQKQIDTLSSGYQAHISELSVNIERFAIEGIANSALGEEMENILPEFEGTLSERLQQAYHNAIANGVDATAWAASGEGLESAVEWLGLEDLTSETQSAVAKLMGEMASSLPEDMSAYITEGFKNINTEEITNEFGKNTANGIMKGIASEENATAMSEGLTKLSETAFESADYSGVVNAFSTGFSTELSKMDIAEAGAGLQEGFQNMMMTTVEEMDMSSVGQVLNTKLGESMSAVDMSESGAGLQEGIQASLNAALENIDFSGAASSINMKLMEALTSVEGVDMSGFTTVLQTGITSSVEGMEYSGITSAVGSGISAAISNTIGEIQTAISTLYSNVAAAINSAFSAGFQTTTTVTVTVNYQLANPSATINFSGGGTGTATVSGSIASNANGGYSNGPELTLWGEDGPEVIIPLGSKRRSRGLELWMQAGEILGVPKNANGGITRGTGFFGIGQKMQDTDIPINGEETDAEAYHTNLTPEKTPNKTEVHLNMAVNPQFIVSGKEDTDVLRTIREHMGELADDMSGAIYQKLKNVFENMPISSI